MVMVTEISWIETLLLNKKTLKSLFVENAKAYCHLIMIELYIQPQNQAFILEKSL